MSGVAEGLDNAVDTLTNIGKDKKKLENEQKEFDVDMKIKGLQLQKLEGQMDPELYKIQNELLKKETKAKTAYLDYTLSFLGRQQKIETDKVKRAESYIKGADVVVQDVYAGQEQGQGQGMNIGGMEFDLEKGLSGKFPYKKVTSTERLSRDKATEELKKRGAAKLPLDTKVVEPKKGFLGFGGNAETVEFAKTIKTRQDLINMVKNADALEDRGIGIDQLEKLYEDELLKLATDGYLTEK